MASLVNTMLDQHIVHINGWELRDLALALDPAQWPQGQF